MRGEYYDCSNCGKKTASVGHIIITLIDIL